MRTVEELQQIVCAEIEARSKEILAQIPVGLYEPISYSLEMGGKRLRPVFLLLAYNMFSKEIEKALPAAVAIEVYHNFTLLHDDIMDKADVRRNRPTVHKKYDENTAILSGDTMAFQSYKYFLECQSPSFLEALTLFNQTTIEVCEGQQYDMEFENRMDVTVDEYIEMIRLKTAALLAGSLKIGAILANAPSKAADDLYNFGINIGLAFQLQDDLLDTFGDQATFGKKIGGDILANKKTFLLINALEKTSEKERAELTSWINKTNFKPEEKINAVTAIYNSTGVKSLAETEVNNYFKKAINIINQMEIENVVKQPLLQLAHKMLKRKH